MSKRFSNGIDLQGAIGNNFGTPQNSNDAVNKAYADTKFAPKVTPQFETSVTVNEPGNGNSGALIIKGAPSSTLGGKTFFNDTYGSNIRWAELGGTFRGFFVDLSECAAQEKLFHTGNFQPSNYIQKTQLGATSVLPIGAQAGTEQALADQLKVLPRHFGVVANAFLNSNGTLASGTDQTAGLNAYFAYCHANGIRPCVPTPADGAGYLILGSLKIYDEGDYAVQGNGLGFVIPNSTTSVTPITIEPDANDVIKGTVSDVLGWSRLTRGSIKLPGLGITSGGVNQSLKGHFVTISTSDECTFGRDIDSNGFPRFTSGGHGFYVNSDEGDITQPLYVDFRPQGASTNKVFTANFNGNNRKVFVWRRQHGLPNNTPIVLSSTGALPSGLSQGGTVYYVSNATRHAFQLATSVNGAPIPWTADGSGTHTIIRTSNPPNNVAVTFSTPSTVSAASHGMVNGDPIRLITNGSLPAGLSQNTTYYVVNTASNAFQLATSVNGTAVAFTSAGTGTHTAIKTVTGSNSFTAPMNGPTLVIANAHGITEGCPIRFVTDGTLPTGLNLTSTYCAVNVSANNFYVARGPFLPGIAMTDDGSANGGVHTCTASPEWAWPWTDRLTEVIAQKVKHPIRISGLKLTLYKPATSAGNRNTTLVVRRCATTVDLPHLDNRSGLPIAQGILFDKTYRSTLNEAHVAGLLDAGTNYSVHVGLSNCSTINASSGVDCRRSFDTHRGYGITINGGVWSNGIGGHWGVDVRINNAVINNGPHCVHLAGRDFHATNCHFVVRPEGDPGDIRASLFNVREDEFNLSGALVFKGCLVDVDATGLTNPLVLINNEGPPAGYDAYRPHEMPSNISMDSSNTVRVWGKTDKTVIHWHYLRDFDDTMKQPIVGARNVNICPVVTFDNEDLVLVSNGVVQPRCRVIYRKANNLTGLDCCINLGNTRDMYFTALPGSSVIDNSSARAILSLQSNGHVILDGRGGALKRAKIEAPSYVEIDRRGTWTVGDERVYWNDALLGAEVKRTFRIQNPSAGSTFTAPGDKPQVYLVGSSTLASLTLNLPANAVEDQRCAFIFQMPVSSTTFNGNGLSIAGSPPNSVVAGQKVEFQALNVGSGVTWQHFK